MSPDLLVLIYSYIWKECVCMFAGFFKCLLCICLHIFSLYTVLCYTQQLRFSTLYCTLRYSLHPVNIGPSKYLLLSRFSWMLFMPFSLLCVDAMEDADQKKSMKVKFMIYSQTWSHQVIEVSWNHSKY